MKKKNDTYLTKDIIVNWCKFQFSLLLIFFSAKQRKCITIFYAFYQTHDGKLIYLPSRPLVTG